MPKKKKRKPERTPDNKAIDAPENKALKSPENKGRPLRPPIRK
jgi:hypothetical protein